MQVNLLRTLILMLCLTAACGPTEAEQTLVANHALVSTQILTIRETATLEAARMRTTVEAAETRVSLLATQSQFLKATAVANGSIMAELESFQQEFMGGMVSAPVISTAQPNNPSTLPQTNNPQAPLAPQVTRERIQPQAPPPTSVAENTDPSAPRLSNTVTSTGVGQDDCPINTTASFSTSTPEIYVSARAFNITTGTNFQSRWFLRNEEMIQHQFDAGFDFDDACVWFFIDQDEVVFTPGEWSVILYINGTQASDAVPFSISDGS